ncbi:hypothetical protein CcaverHIS002_0308660 [Cutaneotrichosporon cavernicola]|nr:hypothetical protein CcaverHIS002_0308660 [Cutaneotrichosporon cavernicola]
MGLFKRLRAASGARKPPESASQSSTSADSSATSTRILKRSPSTNLLAVPPISHTPPPRVSTSSTVASASSSPSSARSSILPWKKDKRRNTEELQPPRPSPNSYSQHNGPPSPSASPSHTQHARNPSHESQRTVISLSSTFTGRSRHTSSSTDWRQEGGVLGKFAFESNDWGNIGAATPLQSPPPSAGPSKQTTPGTSPSKLTSHSAALAMSPTSQA